MDMDSQSAAPGSTGVFWPNFVVFMFVVMYAGYVGLLIFWPKSIARVVETENGRWMGGLTVGLLLGMMMLGVTVVMGLLNLQRR